jgi:membrane protein
MGDGAISKLKKIYDATHAFVTEKGIELYEESRMRWFHRFAHFCLLVVKSFNRNRCPSRATALAYTTLLALIPLLALVMSISSSLFQGKDKQAVRKIIGQAISKVAPQLALRATANPAGATAGNEEVVTKVYEFITNLQGSTLGVTGTIGLIVVAILLLATIEDTFNDIWGVTRGRTWFARIVQYWAIISLGPVLLVSALALKSGPYFASTERVMDSLPVLKELLFHVLPYVIASLTFALLYKLIPNTQIEWRAALLGGAIGGCLWMLNNVYSAIYLSRVIALEQIYGRFGTIPLFLIGLYFSWLIVLIGAQVGYALQNRQVYLQEKKAESVNQRGREFVALRIMTYVAQRFATRQSPPTHLQIAEALAVPSRLVGRVIGPLLDERLLVEVRNDETAYTLAAPLEKINCQNIIQALRAGAGQELETRDDATRALVRSEFEKIQNAERASAASVTLKDLVERVPDPEKKESPA